MDTIKKRKLDYINNSNELLIQEQQDNVQILFGIACMV
jgi:hypothetical protein